MRKSVTIWSAILLLGLAVLGGCRPAGGEIHLSTDLNELILATLWSRVAQNTDFQPRRHRLSHPGESDCEIWFPEQAVAKADQVEPPEGVGVGGEQKLHRSGG